MLSCVLQFLVNRQDIFADTDTSAVGNYPAIYWTGLFISQALIIEFILGSSCPCSVLEGGQIETHLLGGGSTERLCDGRSGLPSAGHGFTCGDSFWWDRHTAAVNVCVCFL